MFKFCASILFFSSLCASPPPREIPSDLWDAYTDQGQIRVVPHYNDDTAMSVGTRFFHRNELNDLIEKAKRKEANYYGITDQWLYEILDRQPELVVGKKVAIMGSTVPWYEAVILSYGGIPVTIDYNRIESNDDRLEFLTVEELQKNLYQFDTILSISSFEHDGLGRYGDPLDPTGDFRAMRECLSFLKPKGKLILAVPVGGDCIAWNSHRIYGPKRLPKLLEGWKIIDYAGNYKELLKNPAEDRYLQPVFLLEPQDDLDTQP